MSRQLTLKLTDAVYDALTHRASETGTSPAMIASQVLETQVAADRQDTARHRGTPFPRPVAEMIGAIDLGRPTGTDNRSIDADLAREYSDPGSRT